MPAFAHIAKVDGCTDAPTTTFTKGTAECRTHRSCNGGVEVTLCSLDAGHVAYANRDGFSVAERGWLFLSRHQL